MPVNNDKLDQFICKGCSWEFPDDLIEILKKENVVYCEKCGVENFKNEYNFYKKPKPNEQPLSEIIKSKGKKAVQSFKSKWTDFKKKILENLEK